MVSNAQVRVIPSHSGHTTLLNVPSENREAKEKGRPLSRVRRRRHRKNCCLGWTRFNRDLCTPRARLSSPGRSIQANSFLEWGCNEGPIPHGIEAEAEAEEKEDDDTVRRGRSNWRTDVRIGEWERLSSVKWREKINNSNTFRFDARRLIMIEVHDWEFFFSFCLRDF